MADLNVKLMKNSASRRLEAASYDPKRLILIHTGVLVVLNLLTNWLNLFLNEQIGTTGGLDGLGMRSVLETVQTLLGYFTTFFTPFWTAGLLHAMIRIARGQETGPRNLMLGFRRFGRIMSHTLWQLTIITSLCIMLMYVVCTVFVMTPFAEDFLTMMEPLLENPELFLPDGSLNLALVPLEETFTSLIPLFILYAIVLIPAYVYLSYQFRLSLFLLVEGMERGAFGSFIVSGKLMKGHKWQMLKLDLSFWWYYALELLLTFVLYLDLILPALGVTLPMDATAAYFVTISLYGVLELALHWWKKAEIDVTYATAYEAIYRQFVPLENDTEASHNL